MAEHIPAPAAHGEPVAGTVAHDGGHAPEPTFLGLGGAWFVSAAMLAVFALLIWKKVPQAIGRALDARIAGIRDTLKEAEKLRAEAEALRNEYQAKADAADAERDTMLERARQEAQAIVEKAKTDTDALIERRTRMAEDKIAAAERAAIDDVRARAVAAAAAAAESLIRDEFDAKADKAMIDATIAELGRR
jgi:F-type H+-transporting ATPase subunit b